MTRARIPIVVGGTMLLGLVALGGGGYLMFADCTTDDCINTTIGIVFMVLGVIGLLSRAPNLVGLVCFLSTLGFALFLGLVFVFARQPAGILPPLLFAILAFAEQDLLRRYYASPRAHAPTEVS